MTDGNPRPDEDPIRPTHTRWSGDAEERDDELAPPFIPGQTSPAETAPDATESPADTGEEGGEGHVTSESQWVSEPAEEPEGGEDGFPFGAFEIEGGEEPGQPAAAETAQTGTGEAPAIEKGAAHELADRLEAMARRLREQGPEAAETDLNSEDRFTALLAGLLAGYLAGRG